MRNSLTWVWLLAAPLWAAPSELVKIPGGRFRPFYRVSGEKTPAPIPVAAFRLARNPVTNREYLEFVRARPQWRRSQIKRLFAEKGYLRHWQDDLHIDPQLADSPVVNVSWFAARAYCQWRGQRLPSLNEWEYVGQASETQRDGSKQPDFRKKVLAWYGKPTPNRLPAVGHGFRNVYGINDTYGLVWEWVDDFNTLLGTGESRGDAGLERELYCAAGAVSGLNPDDYPTYMRYAFRSSLKARYVVPNLGFRMAHSK